MSEAERRDERLHQLEGGPDSGAENTELRAHVISALESVYDPEIPVNIYEMGLIYELRISDSGNVAIQMTLTSPACPVAGSLPGEVETQVRQVEGVNDVSVELVWDPPWTMERMSEAAKLELGFL
ncbi:MAG: SUF system Fe-S cluster assembly protein [Acidobacteriota bacterium]|nr:MAG: SUF system Fe-S cluster assembly protein [Acidobacteriota bacterium]